MAPDRNALVSIAASVSPTEDPHRVMGAILQALGDVPHSVRSEGSRISVESSAPGNLDRLHDQLRDRRVRATARRRLLAGRSGRRTTVMLNRQAASVGVLVLCDDEKESPLGPIFLTIRSDDLDGVIQWLTEFPSG